MLNDGGGLCLRVRDSGTKDWIFRYKLPYSSKRVDMSFGKYPAVKLVEARERRARAQELLAKDIDPRAFKEQTKRVATAANANTFAKIMTDWIEVKATKVSSDHTSKIKSSLENHVLPAIGKRPIGKQSASEVVEVLKPAHLNCQYR